MARSNLAYPRPYRHARPLQLHSDEEARVSPCISSSRLLRRPVLPDHCLLVLRSSTLSADVSAKDELLLKKCPRVSSDANATVVNHLFCIEWQNASTDFFSSLFRRDSFCEDNRSRDLSSGEDNDVVVCLPRSSLSLSLLPRFIQFSFTIVSFRRARSFRSARRVKSPRVGKKKRMSALVDFYRMRGLRQRGCARRSSIMIYLSGGHGTLTG